MGRHEFKIDIDTDLIAEAQKLGVDLSAAGVAGIERALSLRRDRLKTNSERSTEANAWARENADALNAYRDRIETYGVFGEDFRTW